MFHIYKSSLGMAQEFRGSWTSLEVVGKQEDETVVWRKPKDQL